jgi:hypothetical protein
MQIDERVLFRMSCTAQVLYPIERGYPMSIVNKGAFQSDNIIDSQTMRPSDGQLHVDGSFC